MTRRSASTRFRYAAGLIVGLALATSASAADTVPAWASTQLSAWLAAYNARDASAIGAFYSPRAVLRPYGKAAIHGRAAIVKHYREGLVAETATCAGGFDRFRLAADVAVGWGFDRCDYPPTGGVRPPAYRARWMLIFERDSEGHWLIVEDVDEGPSS